MALCRLSILGLACDRHPGLQPAGRRATAARRQAGRAGHLSGTGGQAGAGQAASGGAGGAAAGGTAGGSVATGPLVGDFLGLNGFIDDDPAKLAAVGNVREYHDWSWNEGNGAAGYPGYPNNQLSFTNVAGAWDFDAYYAALGQAGVTPFPCIEGSVDFLGSAMPPVSAGADVTVAASYVAHASFLYQYAARYGAKAVPTANLKLASGQAARTGLGLLRYYEDGNEPDANWVNADGSPVFSPAAAAAMSSADYDGDQGRLGGTFGIKSADPAAKLVLAGLAGAGASSDWLTNVTTYLDGMRAWATAHRGGSFPADVLNVHDYCFGPDPFGTKNPRPGVAPEACGIATALAGVVAYRDQHLPGKEVWLTEFGYDTDPGSRLRAPAIGERRRAGGAGAVVGADLPRADGLRHRPGVSVRLARQLHRLGVRLPEQRRAIFDQRRAHPKGRRAAEDRLVLPGDGARAARHHALCRDGSIGKAEPRHRALLRRGRQQGCVRALDGDERRLGEQRLRARVAGSDLLGDDGDADGGVGERHRHAGGGEQPRRQRERRRDPDARARRRRAAVTI